MSAQPGTRILVWDLPIRAFHWLLVATFAGAFLTAEWERARDVHVALGYAFGALLAFRILWGAVGSRYARFASFAFAPRAVLAYLRSLLAGRPEPHVGHNPAGSWVIYALLALGFGVAATGWAIAANAGGHAMEELHEGIAYGLLALATVHVAGVVVASIMHRENLAAAMVTGRKTGRVHEGIRKARWPVALALLAGVTAAGLSGPQLTPASHERGGAVGGHHHDRARHHGHDG